MSGKRSSAKRLAIFNHKGGVGKTTLSVNIAFALGALGKRVLLVDSDPQCNLTAYLINEDVVDDLLTKSDTANGRTIWTAVKPISEASGDINIVKPYERGKHVYVIPGDIRLSEFESDLNEFWAQAIQGKVRGFRGTTAISHFVDTICKQNDIDYVFYDIGPNIGPLNRIIILDCNYFIIPVACDLFSQRALKTLGRTLATWIEQWQRIAALAPAGTYLLPGKPRFLGYIPQGFKVYANRVISAQSHYLSKIEREISSQIVNYLKKQDPSLVVGSMADLKLGQVPQFGGIIASAQSEGIPLAHTSLASMEQRKDANKAFTQIANKIIAKTSIRGGK